MIESLIFMGLMLLGSITLIGSSVLIAMGLWKKEKSVRNTGFGIGIIPVLCFGLIYYWYEIVIPSINQEQMNDFAGMYIPTKMTESILTEHNQLNKPIRLELNSDGTYEFDSVQGIGLKESGTWETGGIDGNFNFYDGYGNLADFGIPAGSGEHCSLTFQFHPNPDEFFDTESINFEKIK